MGEGVVVNDGDLITFTTAEDILELPKSIHEIQKFNDVNPGERILLDDGKLIFEIVETDKKNRSC
jgi:pyruvate kinase